MNAKIMARVLVLLLIVFQIDRVRADSPPGMEKKWQSAATGQSLRMTVLEPQKSATNQPLPLIIYLVNLAAPRTGTDSDSEIVRDFLEAGYLVVTVDYARDAKARMPFINQDLAELRAAVSHKNLVPEISIDPAHVFIVPSGDRLRRDVVYYQDTNRTLAMDIVYPAHPAKSPGAVLEFSCDNQNRMGNESLVICCDTILDGEATEGLATAMADHPVAAPYKGFDAMPECAWKIKAAVRTLRAEGAKLALNGRIVPAGFSRGSGMALMLLTTQGMTEFEQHGENVQTNSEVQGAVVMSGRFNYLDLLANDKMIPRYNKVWGERTNHFEIWKSAGAMDYLEHATLPIFLTINCSESPDALHQMKVLRRRLSDLGNDEIFLMDPQPRGHKVTLVPDILEAMDLYLKKSLE
jgi:hypothetical protein